MPTAEATGACAHCGLPVPAALPRSEASEQFCCDGCASVHAILAAEGLERWYALREAGDSRPEPARTTGGAFTSMDDPEYRARACRPREGGLLEVDWVLEGVHCAACVWLVERLPRLADGVVEARLDLPRARVRVVWDPARTALSAVARRLDRFGYPPHPFRGARREALRRAEDRRMLARLGIAGACAANVMAIAFALWGGILDGMDASYDSFFRWASLVVTVPALVWGAGPFFRGALSSVTARRLHMDVPIAIGIVAGFAHGVANTLRGSGVVYFDSVTALIFLLLAGRFLQLRQQRRAADAAELLAAIAPSTARLLGPDGAREVPVESLLPGMRVEVRGGETVPADGTIEEGESALDLSLLTGESAPADAGPGDAVHAGTVNVQARLVVRVDAAGELTRIGRLLRLVEESAARKAPMVLLADRLAGAFVGVVLLLAASTALLWWRLDPSRALDHAIALLVVTCPCALGLATPLAFSAAVGQAARAGILIRGADVLERLAAGGRMWLDKTGTLTEGRLRVVRWTGDEAARAEASALEAHSAHPVAAALAAEGARGLDVREVRETRGAGIAGIVEGRRLVVGSPRFVVGSGARIPPWAAAETERWTGEGLTPVVVARDGEVVAVAGLGDRLREESPAAIARARELGFAPGILSGDDPRAVDAVAASLGIVGGDVRGGASPEEKAALVREEASRGTVVMVGDGVNDAAALAAASVGVGVHGGAEAALAAADVYITRPGIGPLVELVEGSRRAMRVVRRNLALSLAYNVAGVALAMAGRIDPLVAAAMMPLSSLTVIVSSYRARTFRCP